MKSKVLISSVIGGVIILGGFLAYFQNVNNMKSKLTVQPIGGKGIFVGEANKGRIDFNSYDHQIAIKTIDEAWDYIRLGNSYYRSENYQEAVKAYEKSYAIGGGSKAVSGFKLAETYAKLGRNDEAIAQLDRMIQNRELSELGIQDANALKSKLLSAKAH